MLTLDGRDEELFNHYWNNYLNSEYSPCDCTCVVDYNCPEYRNRYRILESRNQDEANDEYNRLKRNREEAFRRALTNGRNITYEISYSGSKWYSKTTYNSFSNGNTTKYNKSQEIQRADDGVKFSEVFNRDEFHSVRVIFNEIDSWFWENVDEDEDLARIKNILKYLLNIATNSERYGTFTPEEIEQLFNAFEPAELVNVAGGRISAFGTTLTRDEFVNSVQTFTRGGSDYGILAGLAEDFYDICTREEYNINPCIAFAWACEESGFASSTPYNNLFGMDISNGQSSGAQYETFSESIEDFCRWVIERAELNETIVRAQEFATVNSKFNGSPQDNIYALFCKYMFLGYTHIVDEPDFNNPAGTSYYISNGSTSGGGGRLRIYEMYEQGGLYTGEYATRCGHPNGSDPTTLQEQADYAQYSIELRLKIAKDVFGTAIFQMGEGTYEEINEGAIYGIYTSSFGRTYTEWRQSRNDQIYGQLYLRQWNDIMGGVGCGLYAGTMLLNSVGINATPEDFYNDFNYDFIGTINRMLNEYNVSGEAKRITNIDNYFSVLLNGHGVMSYLSSASNYTYNKHWIVVADIRETQTGSTYGYDLYVLSSTRKPAGEYGWVPAEEVVPHMQVPGDYGIYVDSY